LRGKGIIVQVASRRTSLLAKTKQAVQQTWRKARATDPNPVIMTVVSLVALLLCVISIVHSYAPLSGIKVRKVDSGMTIDLGSELALADGKTLCVLGTYAADFNAIEYCQRLRYYLPFLKERGVQHFYLVLNASPESSKALADAVDLSSEVVLLSDPTGAAGRAFGVSRGWRPDDLSSPYVKLFGMLFGLGAWATLPAVIGGYIGNPWSKQPWIEAALAQGQRAGRWPDTALELSQDGIVNKNKFDDLPYVGDWGRRPLELATLRLQNMLGVSLKSWNALKPSEEELKAGVLTQLGGCLLLDDDKKALFDWKDAGICHVANFAEILESLEK